MRTSGMNEATELDFTKEDQGKFRHPETVGGILYTELERRVFVALNAGFRTLSRIKAHAGLEPSFDLSWVIEGMEMDEKIRRVDNGTITAFFHFTQMPRRFWMTGDGTVASELDPNFRPTYRNGRKEREFSSNQAISKPRGKEAIAITAEQIKTLAAEKPNMQEIAEAVGYSNAESLRQRLKKDPALRVAFDRGRRLFADGQTQKRVAEPLPELPERKQKSHAAAYQTDITAETFRKYAAAGKKPDHIAEDFDLSLSTVYKRLEWPENLAAWKAGKLEHSAAKHGAEPTPVSGRPAYKRSDNGGNMPRSYRLEIDHQKLREASETLPNLQAIAAAFGIGQPAMSRYLKDTTLRDIYDAGRKIYFASQGKQIPHKLASTKPATSLVKPPSQRTAGRVETKPTELIDTRTFIGMDLDDTPAVKVSPGNPSIIRLSNGSQIALGFTGNFFGLTREERQTMNAIADLIDVAG